LRFYLQPGDCGTGYKQSVNLYDEGLSISGVDQLVISQVPLLTLLTTINIFKMI